jgi:D-inositol-3-phosphate glycosyltransferase
VIETADCLIIATPAEQAQLNWLYGADLDKTVIIPPGVDLERFHPIPQDVAKTEVGIPCGDKTILFVGRIEPLKGIDTMLRAMALIQKRHPAAVADTCLAIIGGDPWAEDPDAEMARLQALRHELDIHDLVTFLGSRDQDILPNYYAAAEMVIMPSHYESFGMVALEAMAMGTPVIASEVGGLAFVVKDGVNGFHVPSRDPEALADRIYTLLTDPACRDSLGQQARQYAQHFAWPIIVERIVNVYQNITKNLSA